MADPMANNLTAEQLIDAMKSMNDTFVKTKKENAELVNVNEYQAKYIRSLEADLLQMTIDKSFYESMFQEEKPPTPKPPTPKPPTPKPPTPKPHPLEIKMKSSKKSLGQVKPYPTREPRYHMTEVARDWAS
jgi:hypothetical protein